MTRQLRRTPWDRRPQDSSARLRCRRDCPPLLATQALTTISVRATSASRRRCRRRRRWALRRRTSTHRPPTALGRLRPWEHRRSRTCRGPAVSLRQCQRVRHRQCPPALAPRLRRPMGRRGRGTLRRRNPKSTGPSSAWPCSRRSTGSRSAYPTRCAWIGTFRTSCSASSAGSAGVLEILVQRDALGGSGAWTFRGIPSATAASFP